MSESEQVSRTPRPSIVGDALKNAELARTVVPDARKLAAIANVREATKAAGLAGLYDSTRLAGLARLSLDATKLAALKNLREATKAGPGVAELAESAKLAGLTNLRDATKVARVATLQERFESVGLTAERIREMSKLLVRSEEQARRFEQFEATRRMGEVKAARTRIDDELREAGLRRIRREAELEAATLQMRDELLELNDGIEALTRAQIAFAEDQRWAGRRTIALTVATVVLGAIVVLADVAPRLLGLF